MNTFSIPPERLKDEAPRSTRLLQEGRPRREDDGRNETQIATKLHADLLCRRHFSAIFACGKQELKAKQ